jgi:hypothetical protein
MVHDSLVCQHSSLTEAVIQRTIEEIQRMIRVNNSQGGEEQEEEHEPIRRRRHSNT